MLKRIWQWLKGVFGRLFGVRTPLPHRGRQHAHSTREDAPTLRPLEDSDYEYLFTQLLEGVRHGWQPDRVLRWFEGLKGRTTEAEWVAWLRRFGERVLASPALNNELAARLLLLGEQTRAAPSLQEIGELAHNIGMQLLDKNPGEPIWEYEGPDASPLIPVSQGGEQIQQEEAQVETITLDDLLARLEQDPNLIQLIAQQVGIETTDPQVIIEALINQFDTTNQPAIEDAETWFDLGNQQADAGDLAGAIASYDKALEIQPDNYEAWINRGNMLVELGRSEEAIASYDQALVFKHDYDDAWNNRGLALLELGRNEEAIASYDQALEFNPDCYEAWFNRGNALVALGRSEEALTAYDKAIEIQPDSYQAWMNRGVVLRYMGRTEDAIASCNKAIEISPESYEVWHIRGAILYDSGNFEEALASFNKAIEINSDFHESWHNRGLALRRLERLDEAGFSFEKAQQIQAKKNES